MLLWTKMKVAAAIAAGVLFAAYAGGVVAYAEEKGQAPAVGAGKETEASVTPESLVRKWFAAYAKRDAEALLALSDVPFLFDRKEVIGKKEDLKSRLMDENPMLNENPMLGAMTKEEKQGAFAQIENYITALKVYGPDDPIPDKLGDGLVAACRDLFKTEDMKKQGMPEKPILVYVEFGNGAASAVISVRPGADGKNATKVIGCSSIALLSGLAGVAEVRGGEAKAKIKNPFYDRPVWRLWTEDQTPVPYVAPSQLPNTFYGTPGKVEKRLFAPPPVKDRLYPDFSQGLRGPAGLPVLKHFDQPPETAGFWDDCFASLDFAHSNMREGWADGYGGEFLFQGQFIKVAHGSAGTREVRCSLGANFTSQSWANRGRNIVDDFASNDDTERSFFFANCIRATPAHASYADGLADKNVDLYDGLYGHSYQSIGASGSEIQALVKMIIAGACMPRATKDLLKRHGAYAIALLTLFKGALPYCDAEGNEVPFENELRHRPAYSSDGELDRWLEGSPYYHTYEKAAHMRRMIELARDMKVAPPVAVLKLLDLSVEKDGKKLVEGVAKDGRIKTVNKTLMRLWGGPGETLHVRVDMRESYDLQDRPLTYECHAVYPNQRNVSVEPEAAGVYRITVRHDPKLPKGRIPVLLFARNGTNIPSNPVFVNFFWPEANDLADYTVAIGSGVTRNLRPVFQAADWRENMVFARPGETVSVRLDAKDPEGFPVLFYRWSGEVGQIRGDRFTFDVPKDDPGRMHLVHLICSDGTGRGSGRLLRVLVSARANVLPEGWFAAAGGELESVGSVQYADGEFRFSGVGPQVRKQLSAGTYALHKVSGNFDVMCRVREIRMDGKVDGYPKLGLTVCDEVSDAGMIGAVCAIGATPSDRPARSRWFNFGSGFVGPSSNPFDERQLATVPAFLRLVRRGAKVAAYVSANGSAWEQIGLEDAPFSGKDAFVGPMLAIENAYVRAGETCRAEGRCQWISPTDTALPFLVVKGTPTARGYRAPAEVKVLADKAEADLRYTLDGTEPTERSEKYSGPILLDKVGPCQVRVRASEPGKAASTVVAVVLVEKP